jgi:hypothetical protein
MNAIRNSCEDMVFCRLYSEIVLSRKPFEVGQMYIHTFLLRMTDIMNSQNIDLSSWDTLYKRFDNNTSTVL